MARIYISIGSNVDRGRNLRSARRELTAVFTRITCSPVYESAAVGFAGDPFLNLVVGADTGMPVGQVDALLTDIEDRHGRDRSGPRYSPRTLDLDLLLYDNLVSGGPVELPRGELTRYAFVLRPMADVEPGLRHPVNGETYARLWQTFDQDSQPLTEIPFDWDATP